MLPIPGGCGGTTSAAAVSRLPTQRGRSEEKESGRFGNSVELQLNVTRTILEPVNRNLIAIPRKRIKGNPALQGTSGVIVLGQYRQGVDGDALGQGQERIEIATEGVNGHNAILDTKATVPKSVREANKSEAALATLDMPMSAPATAIVTLDNMIAP